MEKQDPYATYNKTTIVGVTQAAASAASMEENQPGSLLDIASYLKGSIGKSKENITVCKCTALHLAAQVAVTTDSEMILSYLKWCTVCLPVLCTYPKHLYKSTLTFMEKYCLVCKK